jgi:hypothetical protein
LATIVPAAKIAALQGRHAQRNNRSRILEEQIKVA